MLTLSSSATEIPMADCLINSIDANRVAGKNYFDFAKNILAKEESLDEAGVWKILNHFDWHISMVDVLLTCNIDKELKLSILDEADFHPQLCITTCKLHCDDTIFFGTILLNSINNHVAAGLQVASQFLDKISPTLATQLLQEFGTEPNVAKLLHTRIQ